MSNIVPIDQLRVMSKTVATSQLFGFNNESQAMSMMLLSQAYNQHPMKFIQDYHIIKGRASKKTETAFRQFKKDGGRCKWIKTDDNIAEAELTAGDGDSIVMKYTIEQAKNADLVKAGSNWTKNPSDMLRNRVLSKGIKAIYPQAYDGFLSEDEATDIEPVEMQVNEVVEETVDSTKANKALLMTKLKKLNFRESDMKEFYTKYIGDEQLEKAVANETFLIAKIEEFENSEIIIEEVE